ncbi:hypothetical protein F53441_907 [Fusarium austroafricanum]|uniref:Helicase C-terminal domain-containing protein n=1 Tax=Fusarium austroafricanum TaxID=2364996 RepID=A0A8H4KWW3_9HYPO|nr:hypothetical protein F53441_907 [Fusarium austroafricanum]
MSRSRKRQQNFENDVENGNTSKRAQRKGTSSRVSVSLSCSGSSMGLDLPFHTRAIENDDSREETICYGAICDAQILLNPQTEKPKATQPWDRYCLFSVEIHKGICYLSTGMNVKPSQRSVLDCHTGSVLMFTTDKVRDVSFAVVLGADILHRKRGKSNKKSAVKTTVNIYGPRGSMAEVDKALSEIRSDLQHPVFLERGIAYINPQFYYPSSEKTDLRHLVGPACANTQSETSREVGMVMDCLDNWSEDITTGDNAGADLHRILDQFLLETKLKDLLSHREALGLGGILADVMGLGKTLTMLSAILCSKILKNYALSDKADESSDYQPRSSNLTLIVLPSRPHHIRNPSIKMHKAAAALQSDTRWCLTGTPIQNSFDDLRSLFQFLRFQPFSQNKVFEEYIVKPFREGTNSQLDPSRNLKVMLKACCLRRTQAKLDLPATTLQKVDVVPTTAEKAMFANILEQCCQDFDKMAGKEGSSKKSNILFSAIMKLRRVCNHGGIPIHTSPQKRPNHLIVPKTKRNASRSPSAEPACDFCNDKTREDELLGALDSCPLCGRLQSEENNEIISAAPSPRTMPSSPTGSMMDIDTPEPLRNTFDDLPCGNALREQSSKMSAVVDNIRTSCLDTNSKSVVFSGWRDTLDILARMLFAEGIDFVQVDGRNPLMGRTEMLSRFCRDPSVKVLLISINTGAVGLTLTEANMVHIVEPQWNPTIEEQAIARVVRMGQTRPVTVLKYVTKGSVEQTVVKLQEKKTRIIKLSMQDKDDNDSDMNLDSFKFAIDPNEWEEA